MKSDHFEFGRCLPAPPGLLLLRDAQQHEKFENQMSSPAEDKLYKIRHSLAHVMAQAILEIRPKAKLAFGPPIENGFYYDFDFEQPLTPEDFPEIEKRMRRIIGEKQKFEQFARPADEARLHLEKLGENYKAEYCAELTATGEKEIGFYKNGNFEDMCRGPHVEDTGKIPSDSFSLDSIAGAYWRGDEKRPMLSRVYALAFESKEELEAFKARRQLAMERDHRKLGAELELFRIEEEVGSGLPFWLPHGTVIRDELEKFAKEVEFQWGYERVATPQITKEGLFYTSGHLPYYKDSMFPPMQLPGEGEAYYLKPMNCPFHHLIFRSRQRSYRELPLRLAEYGTCYRYEDSGSLAGLLRVRMLSMNDAHIYCAPEQIKDEVVAVLKLSDFYFKKFRIEGFKLRLSLHDPEKKDKYEGDPAFWEKSESTLKDIVEEMGLEHSIGIGEAAFYGPKVDCQVKNLLGREETASTTQVDFRAAKAFNLNYIGADGKEHPVVVVHRAPLSTHERFVSFLIEHFGGAFPTWMAPVQVMVICVSDKFADYAENLTKDLRSRFIRAEIDRSADSFNKKIRHNVTRKIPNLVIVGGKEAESQSVTWRRYGVEAQRTLPAAEFADILQRNIAARTMDNLGEELI